MDQQEVIFNINKQCQWHLQDLVALLLLGREGSNARERSQEAVTLLDIDFQKGLVLRQGGKVYSCSLGSVDSGGTGDDGSMAVPTRLYDLFHDIHKNMAQEQGKAPWQVKKVIPPSSVVDWAVILLVALPTVCYYYRPVLYWLFLPFGDHSLLLHKLDHNATLLSIIVAEFVTHALETWWFLWPELQFHRVSQKLWLPWILWGLLEGYGPVRRLKRYSSTLAPKPLLICPQQE